MSQPQHTGRRVLAVDDDTAIRELVVAQLRAAGCHVETARDGEEAIAQIQAFRPEAMVLDLSMPKVDGFGVLGWMQKQGLSDQVRTVVLTARHAPADVTNAMSLGARDYLAKPFRGAELALRVARLLIRSREALHR